MLHLPSHASLESLRQDQDRYRYRLVIHHIRYRCRGVHDGSDSEEFGGTFRCA